MIRMRRHLKIKIKNKLAEIEANNERMQELAKTFSSAKISQGALEEFTKTMEEHKMKSIILKTELNVLEELFVKANKYIDNDEKEKAEAEQTKVIEKDGHKLTVKPKEVILEAEGLELKYYRVEGKHHVVPTTANVDGYSLRYDDFGYVKNGRGRMKNERAVLDRIYAGNGFVANEGFIIDLIRK